MIDFFKIFKDRDLELKIVYFGYGLSGKTTNINYIYDNAEERNKIELKVDFQEAHVLQCKVKRFSDVINKNIVLCLTARIGNIWSPKAEFEILKNVDGIVFVAHSHKDLMHLNTCMIEALQEYLMTYGYEIKTMPYVLQCNRRDIVDKLPIDDIAKELRIKDEPIFEAIAYKGVGVFETLDCVITQILRTKYK